MRPMPRLLGLALVTATLAAAAPAWAQAPAPLSFMQPLSPSATMVVQERLRDAGVYTGATDGVWGPESQTALDRFQQARGMVVTGSMNLATAQALGIGVPRLLPPPAEPAAGAAPAGSAPIALSPAAIRNVQARLRALGFYRQQADGLWGAGTQAALERFQRGRGLEPNGQINPTTAQALGLNPSNLEAPAR
ncbi:peptidoglycan-binding protein [Roseomonas terrae]|jgi:peptidoglycan hydrolase-like protein with peptidoglycan-binding domain|uniref:Peptidoglycan-binding protein n=1 Tax=Neoroseomonas terrae TaxID=424799 RepID=A0ABS5EJR2_9PROT|nr:peptidoglycan-binding domain-containing protein [Neoroseomonas terrae]MBR0651256.1 peptidoglycan-binding protein [Neoroseomonas terrae]